MRNFFIIFLLFIFFQIQAQYSALDSTFGGTGIITQFSSSYDESRCVLVQSDQKILVGGKFMIGSAYKSGLVRYNTDGILDPFFGNNGILVLPDSFSLGDIRILQQADHKIVAYGSSFKGTASIIRLLSNGSFDQSFGIGGMVSQPPDSNSAYFIDAVIQSDGKIFAMKKVTGYTGNPGNSLYRYHPNGQLDLTFGQAGVVDSLDYLHSIEIQNTGKILLNGSQWIDSLSARHATLLRLNQNGSLDYSFSNNGKYVRIVGLGSSFRSLLIHDNGDIILCLGYNTGYNEPYWGGLMRLSSSAVVDSMFANGINSSLGIYGFNSYNFLNTQKDGKIIVSGHKFNYPSTGAIPYIFRLTTSGDVDSTFGNNGLIGLTPPLQLGYTLDDMDIMHDGKIVCIPSLSNFSVVRFKSYMSLSIEATNNRFMKIYPNPFNNCLNIENDNSFYLVNMYSASGRKIYSSNILNLNLIKIDLQHHSQGLYIVELIGKNAIMRRKVIKE